MALKERSELEKVIRLHVPFVIEDGDLERGLEILERSLDGRSGA